MSGADEIGRGATTAQLKNDIDSGRTGDKVAGFDPAAAPLGTDAEAGGAPPSPELIAHAREAERAPHSHAQNREGAAAAAKGPAPDGRPASDGAAWKGLTLGFAGAVVVAGVGWLVLHH